VTREIRDFAIFVKLEKDTAPVGRRDKLSLRYTTRFL
jgi:hypothetical protein